MAGGIGGIGGVGLVWEVDVAGLDELRPRARTYALDPDGFTSPRQLANQRKQSGVEVWIYI